MKNLLKHIVLVMIITSACQTKETVEEWSLTSPDQSLKMIVSLNDSSEMNYKVLAINGGNETTVIEESPLGISRNDQSFTENLSFVSMTDPVVIEDNYTLISGKQSNISSEANEVLLTFVNQENSEVQLILRAYDDGVAFKYNFPQESEEIYEIVDESTGFNLPQGEAWIQPYDTVTKYTPAYERYFHNAIAIGSTSPGDNGWCFPALFNTNDHWVLLTEAGLTSSFYGAHLQAEAPDGLYKIQLPVASEAMGKGDIGAESTLPMSTLWRVIIVSEDLGDIVESNLVTHLNPEQAIANTGWIEPGIASWSWWSDHDSPQHYEEMLPFIDLSADMGWQYFLVDANWNIMQGGDIQQIIEYARQKGVDILMWYNSGGPHNTVEEQPRDIMFNPDTRKEEFKKLQEWGVRGIKVDFFQSDKPFIMQLYLDIIKDAAKHEIMVNFHGCTIPRGWSRTYPNLVTLEAVRGAEVYSFGSEYPEYAPWHNTILPATRNVIGSMDYTPVTFTDQRYPHLTSYGHELALSVLFESGIQHFADAVSGYRNLPDAPTKFLQEVPVAWDETQYLKGIPGKDMVVARRKGDSWYVGGINGQDQNKQITITFDFLANETYQVQIISDGSDNRSFSNRELEVIRTSEATVEMLPYGGFVMQITKK
ncbi:MAG: glycoside hydrolase family 97 catalytic domain-containing protein [Cyclobacteriaceae bacterium]